MSVIVAALLGMAGCKPALWEQKYPDARERNSRALDLAKIDASGPVVVGQTPLDDLQPQTLFLAHYSTEGELLWDLRFPQYETTLGGDNNNILALDAEGGSFVVGYERQDGLQWGDLIVLKVSSDGELLWSRTVIESLGDLQDADVAIDPINQQHYVLATLDDKSETTLFAYDSMGNLQWQYNLRSDLNRVESGQIGLDQQGNIFITDQRTLVKLNVNGIVESEIKVANLGIETIDRLAVSGSGIGLVGKADTGYKLMLLNNEFDPVTESIVESEITFQIRSHLAMFDEQSLCFSLHNYIAGEQQVVGVLSAENGLKMIQHYSDADSYTLPVAAEALPDKCFLARQVFDTEKGRGHTIVETIDKDGEINDSIRISDYFALGLAPDQDAFYAGGLTLYYTDHETVATTVKYSLN